MTESVEQLLAAERQARALLQREETHTGDVWTFACGDDADGPALMAAARLASRRGTVAALRVADARDPSPARAALTKSCQALFGVAPEGHFSSAWRLERSGAVHSSPLPAPDAAWRAPLTASASWVEAVRPDHPAPLTCAQCREIDRIAIVGLAIPGVCLMEHAALGAAAVALDMLRGIKTPRVVILAGGGNNGGDGLAMARGLAGLGVAVKVGLLKPADGIKGDAGINLQLLTTRDIPVHSLHARPEATADFLRGADLVVDGLLGTGFAGQPTPAFRTAMDAVNASAIPVLALDLPSGLNGDTGAVADAAVRAKRTVTFAAVKTGLLRGDAAKHTGDLFLADIGAPTEAFDRAVSGE